MLKLHSLLFCIFVFMYMLFAGQNIFAATYHITETSGSDNNSCIASRNTPGHATINGFLLDCGSSLLPGDVITVHCATEDGSCTYTENIGITSSNPAVASGAQANPIQITVDSNDSVTIRSTSTPCFNSGANCPAIWAGGPDWWTVGPGLRFECGSSGNGCIIYSTSSQPVTGFRFTGNTVVAGPAGTNCTDQPIFFGNNGSDNVRFDGNTFDFRNCSTGFGFSGSGNNPSQSGNDWIYAEEDWTFEDNIFYCGDRNYCLEYDSINRPTVRRNYFEDSNITAYKATLQNRTSQNCVIENNVFYHTAGNWSSKYVMLVRGNMSGEPSSDNCIIRHNTIAGNGTEAIVVADTPQNIRIGNNLFSGQWASFVECSGTCGGDITPNRFEYNQLTNAPTVYTCEWASPNICSDNITNSATGWWATGNRPYPYYDIRENQAVTGSSVNTYTISEDFKGHQYPAPNNVGAFSVNVTPDAPAAPSNLR